MAEAATIIATTIGVLRFAHELERACDQFRNAPAVVAAFQSECAATLEQLGLLEALIRDIPSAVSASPTGRCLLQNCGTTTLQIHSLVLPFHEDLQRLRHSEDSRLGKWGRLHLVWNECYLRGKLDAIRQQRHMLEGWKSCILTAQLNHVIRLLEASSPSPQAVASIPPDEDPPSYESSEGAPIAQLPLNTTTTITTGQSPPQQWELATVAEMGSSSRSRMPGSSREPRSNIRRESRPHSELLSESDLDSSFSFPDPSPTRPDGMLDRSSKARQQLLKAVVGSNVERIERLVVAHGIPPDLPMSPDSDTALHVAACAGRTRAIDALVRLGAAINAQNAAGDTPLHRALSASHERAASALIERSADIKMTNSRGVTPLHLAAQRGLRTSVQHLTLLGADVNAQTKQGDLPLNWALHPRGPSRRNGAGGARRRKKGHIDLDLLRILLGDSGEQHYGPSTNMELTSFISRSNPVHQAAGSEELDWQVIDLLAQHASPAVLNASVGPRHWANGGTALYIAARRARDEALGVLLRYGADPNRPCTVPCNSPTPLWIALRKGNMRIARMLLDAGARVDVTNKQGKTMVEWATALKKGEQVRRLLADYGAPIAQPGAHPRRDDNDDSGEFPSALGWDDEKNINIEYASGAKPTSDAAAENGGGKQDAVARLPSAMKKLPSKKQRAKAVQKKKKRPQKKVRFEENLPGGSSSPDSFNSSPYLSPCLSDDEDSRPGSTLRRWLRKGNRSP